MSSFLLDTRVWLWMAAAPERVPRRARALVEDQSSRLLMSAASAWEIAIKHANGRMPLPAPPAAYLPELIRRSGVEIVPIELEHAVRAGTLPDHHADPFDRMIIAQAQDLGIPIITVDPMIARYEVEVIAD